MSVIHVSTLFDSWCRHACISNRILQIDLSRVVFDTAFSFKVVYLLEWFCISCAFYLFLTFDVVFVWMRHWFRFDIAFLFLFHFQSSILSPNFVKLSYLNHSSRVRFVKKFDWVWHTCRGIRKIIPVLCIFEITILPWVDKFSIAISSLLSI